MIEVVGRAPEGEVVRCRLGQGEDPEVVLAARGWVTTGVAVTGRAPRFTLTYAVRPVPPRPAPGAVLGAGERRQRVAAYALVRDGERVLLTQLSERVFGGAGLWVLPGGGVDPGETAGEAVVREVWEETGQRVTDVELVAVSTVHRSSAPDDAESWDFHAVRLLHLGRCADPGEPVVHDVGGSTARAAWVPVGELGAVPLAPWCVAFLSERGLLSGSSLGSPHE